LFPFESRSWEEALQWRRRGGLLTQLMLHLALHAARLSGQQTLPVIRIVALAQVLQRKQNKAHLCRGMFYPVCGSLSNINGACT
jgi:hypothetical protein